MRKAILRDEDRTEHDDFVLNIQPLMSEDEGATLFYLEELDLWFWIVKPLYE